MSFAIIYQRQKQQYLSFLIDSGLTVHLTFFKSLCRHFRHTAYCSSWAVMYVRLPCWCLPDFQSINTSLHYHAHVFRCCRGVFGIFTLGSMMNSLVSFFPTVRLLISNCRVEMRLSLSRGSSSYRHIWRVSWKYSIGFTAG